MVTMARGVNVSIAQVKAESLPLTRGTVKEVVITGDWVSVIFLKTTRNNCRVDGVSDLRCPVI